MKCKFLFVDLESLNGKIITDVKQENKTIQATVKNLDHLEIGNQIKNQSSVKKVQRA